MQPMSSQPGRWAKGYIATTKALFYNQVTLEDYLESEIYLADTHAGHICGKTSDRGWLLSVIF